MERRGFLGSLLVLPFLNKIKPSKDINELSINVPLLDPNVHKKLLGVIIRQDGTPEYIYEDDPVKYPPCIPGSGTFDKMNIVSGSGTLPPGCCGPFICREELI